MKYKAILLSLLVLLGPMLIFMPKPASAAVGGPVVWINPADTKFWAPCQVSKTFSVDVKLWNKMDLTGKNIYAYDFSVGWWNSTYGMACAGGTVSNTHTSMISLVGVSFTSPWTNYFVVANETIHHNETPGWDEYHLAITALDTSPPLTDVQIPLVTLTFHIDSEPCYPDTWTNIFQFEHVTLSDNATHSVAPSEIDNGHYYIYSSEPDAHLEPDATTLPINPDDGNPYIMDYKVGDMYTFQVWMSNMTKVYGFEFQVCYNPNYLVGSVQCITISSLFPAPYTDLEMSVDSVNGYIHVKVLRPTPPDKPLISCAGDALVATFCLTTDAPEAEQLPGNYMLPTKANTTVCLQWAIQYSLCCGTTSVAYAPWDATYTLAMENNTIDYMWRPNKYDLNLDGVVNMGDLSALAKVYGVTPGKAWSDLASPGAPAAVDIFDFVAVAKKYGKPYTPDLNDP